MADTAPATLVEKVRNAPAPLPAVRGRRIYPAAETAFVQSTLPPISTNGLSAEEIEDAINQRIVELNDLASDNKPGALAKVIGELRNDLPEIREAALEIVMQTGSTELIPALQEAASNSDDLTQKAEIAKAIEFLSLPSLVQVSAASSGNRTTGKPGGLNGQPSPQRNIGWHRTPNALQ